MAGEGSKAEEPVRCLAESYFPVKMSSRFLNLSWSHGPSSPCPSLSLLAVYSVRKEIQRG